MSITFQPIPNFASLSEGEAKDILYKTLIPACEKEEVYLSSNGNTRAAYEDEKESKVIFTIEKVMKAFSDLPNFVEVDSEYNLGVAELTQRITARWRDSFTAKDIIAAMLLKGFSAKFPVTDRPTVNCWFSAKIKFPT